MQRYFIPPEQMGAERVVLTGDDAHHLSRVMRAEAGDTIICSNGINREVLARVELVDRIQVEAQIIEELPMDHEAEVEVWIGQSLPKGDKLETVIQKCTELGAHRFIPFVSDRTVVQYDDKKEGKRLERWKKIAKEAAEQAHRNRVPAIDSPASWKQVLKLAAEVDLALICYEQQSGLQLKPLLASVLHPERPDKGQSSAKPRILVLVGPEGGFTAKEIEEAVAAGLHSVSLGKRILRTETAAMAALTCILYEAGEMGG